MRAHPVIIAHLERAAEGFVGHRDACLAEAARVRHPGRITELRCMAAWYALAAKDCAHRLNYLRGEAA